MKFNNLISVQCPFCHADFGFYKVKPRFSCPGCKTTLGSNRSSVDVWAVLIYLLLVAAIWLIGERVLHVIEPSSYLSWAVGSAAAAIAAYCLLAPHAFTLGPDTWSEESSSGSDATKGKKPGRQSGGSAGAEKRSS